MQLVIDRIEISQKIKNIEKFWSIKFKNFDR